LLLYPGYIKLEYTTELLEKANRSIRKMKPLAPIYEGAARRWVVRHMLIGLGLGFGIAEAYWHLYELPRRRQRDEYYRGIGVEWKHLV